MGNYFQSFQQKCYFYMFHYSCQICFWFQKFFSFQKIKPLYPEMNWVNVYERIKDHSKNHYRFHYEDESEAFGPFLEKEYDYFLKNCIKMDLESEQLFMAKEKENYLFLQFQSLVSKPEKLLSMPEISNIDFVYVEYKHPSILKEIELIIPRGYYLVGNELFSPAFILRMLQMQSTYFVFDERYSIRIMDHEVKTIHFGPESYVLIQKDDYLIKKIEEPEVESKESEEDYLIFSEEETVPFTMYEIMRILFPK
jgi:hypothetical protein